MQWEYLVIKEKLETDALTELGAIGWELVAVASPGHFVLHHFLKRPARD